MTLRAHVRSLHRRWRALHFRYDFAQRTSWAVDVLGRKLEVHYNEDGLVIASRDYGGERYAMDLDEAGNLIGLTLPDGNKLAFKHDDSPA